MRPLRPYSAYKDSGVEWLGDVPEHWEVRRLGTSVEGCINGIWGNDPNGSEDLPCVRVADFDRVRLRVRLEKPTLRAIAPGERNRRLLKKGDLLLEKSGGGDLQPVGVVMLYDHDAEAVCSNFVARMPVSARCDSSYLMYLHSHLYAIRLNVRSIKQTTGIQNLDSSSYLGEPVSFPPLPEQAAIVRFLDHADRRIRRYIHAKQKLVKLLEEQKQVLIHQIVTRGLDPNVRLKPSGVEWLGDVPEHWEVRRLKWVTRLQRGYDLPADRRVPGPFPVVSSGGFIDTHSESRCAGPGVVMGRYGSTDAVFYVEQDFWPHNTSLFVTHFQGNTQKWCYYLLRSITKADHAGKSAVPGLDRNDLFQIVVPVPPVDEQREVVRTIEVATHDLNDAISAARREIDLLREYRTRLIANVVTGKLDVRESAAQLPDEVEEQELLDETDALIDGDGATADDLDTTPEEAAV